VSTNDQYYRLLIKVLTRTGFSFNIKASALSKQPGLRATLAHLIHKKSEQYIFKLRVFGRDWPAEAETMVGVRRLQSLLELMKKVKEDDIEGDFVECGVWRGGVLVLMATFLQNEKMNKKVWGYDSFEGLPKPSGKYLADINDIHYTFDHLAVSKTEVIANLKKYDVDLNDLYLIEGWFSETTKDKKPHKISILRLDGDMYESTLECLQNLYPQVAKSGFIIIDDYNIPNCRQAVDYFIKHNELRIQLIKIDKNAVYFKKP
jgi:O-methyltransferase